MATDNVRIVFDDNLSELTSATIQYRNELVKNKKAQDDLYKAGKLGAKEYIDALSKIDDETNKLDSDTKKLSKDMSDGMANSGKGGTMLSSTLGSLKGMVAGAFAVSSLVAFAGQVINITAKFEKYKAVLTNTFGSEGIAVAMLDVIKEFSANTPYSVDQVTQAFVKLSNQGFVPTKKELSKLGDLASSTGKDFDQLAEAIIDSQTGEFERLKEFGIKAEVAGDKVSFTFKGVKTTVDNTAESIKQYILSLGDLEGVSGSMDAQSRTLGGAISNLGDAWDSFMVKLGGSIEPILKPVIEHLTHIINAVTNDKLNQFDVGVESTKNLIEQQQLLGQERLRILKSIGDEKIAFEELAKAEARNFKENSTRLLTKSKSVKLTKELAEIEAQLEKNNSLIQLNQQKERASNNAKEQKAKSDLIKISKELGKLEDKIQKARTEDVQSLNDEIDKQVKEYEDVKLTLSQTEYIEQKRIEAAKELLGVKKEEAEITIDNSKTDEEAIKKKKEAQEAYTDFAIESAEYTANQLLAIQDRKNQAELDKQMEQSEKLASNAQTALQNQLSEGVITQETFNKLSEQIEVARLAREAKIKQDAWIKERNAQLLQIGINTAVGVSKVIAQTGVLSPAAIIPIIGLGALQAAFVLAQPVPKFAKGGYTGKGGAIDETGHRVAGVVHDNEYVVPKEMVISQKPLIDHLENIRTGKSSKKLVGDYNNFMVNDNTQVVKAIQRNKVVSLDDKTIKKLTQNARRTHLK
jgi:phage tail tape-measure protein